MQHDSPDKGNGSGIKHWFAMILCCLPMIAIVVLLALGWSGFR